MNRARHHRILAFPIFTACVVFACGVICVMNGCATQDRRNATTAPAITPHTLAVGLGNLRIGKPPSAAEVQLAQFLFGVEPDAGMVLLKPMDLGVSAGRLLICEGAFQRVLRWTPDGDSLSDEPFGDAESTPGAMYVAPNGDVLIATAGGSVQRFRSGSRIAEYRLPNDENAPRKRVGGIACVGNEVWLTNLADHRIEIFDAASARHIRSIGKRGAANGEFGLPLGIAASDDNVFVVDMLNARVQVFGYDGEWRRNIGGPGDRLGYFGRPRGIAVGPDGTVFVVDAALQRVTAFDSAGVPLTAFGGTGESDALVLPAGIAIWRTSLNATRSKPDGFDPTYYVLVSEQISRPGIRVFAWRSPTSADFRVMQRPASLVRPVVSNPHFESTRCNMCHVVVDGRPQPIAPGDVDRLCLSCHDGERAVAEAHPIGRVAESSQTRLPENWPVVEGRISCLTCHDMQRHCESPERPVVNAALVRGYDPLAPLNICRQCHVSETWRINPHRGVVAGANSPTASCGFCHTASVRTVESAAVGQPEYAAALRDTPTHLCLNCHTMHADPAPQGHLNRHVPDRILDAMARANVTEAVDPDASQQATSRAVQSPTLLPLENGAVTCATCHNPHPAGAEYAEMFHSPASRLRSARPEDIHKSLRFGHVELCLHCHPR